MLVRFRKAIQSFANHIATPKGVATGFLLLAVHAGVAPLDQGRFWEARGNLLMLPYALTLVRLVFPSDVPAFDSLNGPWQRFRVEARRRWAFWIAFPIYLIFLVSRPLRWAFVAALESRVLAMGMTIVHIGALLLILQWVRSKDWAAAKSRPLPR